MAIDPNVTINELTNAITESLANQIYPKLLEWAGILSVIFIIWGGIQYIIGGEKGAETGKKIITAVIIGLIIIALSSLIISQVVNLVSPPGAPT